MRIKTSGKISIVLIFFILLGTSFAKDTEIKRIERALEKTKGNKKRVYANSRAVAAKSSNTFSAVFPDVCKTPSPAGPIPIPYPNIAKASDTAKGSKKVKADQAASIAKKSKVKKSESDEIAMRMARLQKKYKKIIAKRDLTTKERDLFKKELKICLDESRALTKTLDNYVEDIETLLDQAKKQK
jgi:hypothetical protein